MAITTFNQLLQIENNCFCFIVVVVIIGLIKCEYICAISQYWEGAGSISHATHCWQGHKELIAANEINFGHVLRPMIKYVVILITGQLIPEISQIALGPIYNSLNHERWPLNTALSCPCHTHITPPTPPQILPSLTHPVHEKVNQNAMHTTQTAI